MNIKSAKEQIKNAMIAYFSKDDNGEYIVPIEKQRPVFLMGPPGIGKTAIMEQIAAEMNVGLLSYSMTHHTRQSALGLPFIEHKNYKGMEFDISEYTMSEIIASVYDLMEKSGVEEGILFLDEINCVSETLSPIMLQFLQYKVFGRHKVPDGWIVVTAGNPPEYNNSVREFDIVTWDRLKRVDVDPDFDVWKEYAYYSQVHPSVITYLEIKKADFYKIESTVDGKQFVTARGWDDLSQMIKLYEKNGISVDLNLVAQYLQNPRISKDFVAYYELFNKYKSDYQVDAILQGISSDEIKQRAKNAKFDERLSLLGLLLSAICGELKEVVQKDLMTVELLNILKAYKVNLQRPGVKPSELLEKECVKIREGISAGKISGSISRDTIARNKSMLSILENQRVLVNGESNPESAFAKVKADFEKRVEELKIASEKAKAQLDNVFVFCEDTFTDGQEILILVTELTSNSYAAKFIGRFGSDKYFKHNKDLLFYERQQEIDKVLESIALE